MITKASEAIPQTEAVITAPLSDGRSLKLTLELTPCFSAKQCAEIAKAYLLAWREWNGKGSCRDGKTFKEWALKFAMWESE